MSYFYNPEPYSKKAQAYQGVFQVPGCKSISHRAFMIPITCGYHATLQNVNPGHDVTATRLAFEKLGVRIQKGQNETSWVIDAFDLDHLVNQGPFDIHLENSGTSARLLMGLFASVPGLKVRMIGDDSLMSRPMARVQKPLLQMGADIRLDEKGRLPAIICGAQLSGISYALEVASAQVKSALLLAGLRSKGLTHLVEPGFSRDHTENLLAYLGYAVEKQESLNGGFDIKLDPSSFELKNNRFKEPLDLLIPGDASAAAFWCVAASITKGSSIEISDVNANPSRLSFIDVLKKMGADIHIKPKGMRMGEPLCDIFVQSAPLKAIHTVEAQSASLMDEYPILCVAAAFAEGVSVFEGVQELRVKESNRIQKILDLLHLFGIFASEENQTITVHGQSYLSSSSVLNEPFYEVSGDHRMAMSALILARGRGSCLRLSNIECIDTSFPSFLKQFQMNVASLDPSFYQYQKNSGV